MWGNVGVSSGGSLDNWHTPHKHEIHARTPEMQSTHYCKHTQTFADAYEVKEKIGSGAFGQDTRIRASTNESFDRLDHSLTDAYTPKP